MTSTKMHYLLNFEIYVVANVHHLLGCCTLPFAHTNFTLKVEFFFYVFLFLIEAKSQSCASRTCSNDEPVNRHYSVRRIVKLMKIVFYAKRRSHERRNRV